MRSNRIDEALYGRKYSSLQNDSTAKPTFQGKRTLFRQGIQQNEDCVASLDFLEPWVSKAGAIHNELLHYFIVNPTTKKLVESRSPNLISHLVKLCSIYFTENYLQSGVPEEGVLQLMQNFMLAQLSDLRRFIDSKSFSPLVESASTSEFKKLYNQLIADYPSSVSYDKVINEVEQGATGLGLLESSLIRMSVSIARSSQEYWHAQLVANEDGWPGLTPDNEVARSNPPGFVYADLGAGGLAMLQAGAAVFIPVIGPPATAGAIIGSAAISSGAYAIGKYFGISWP